MMGKKSKIVAAMVIAVIASMLSVHESGQAHGLKEKITHLQFYLHNNVSGANVTAVPVASAAKTNTSIPGFGDVAVMDDPLTEGPAPTSKLVGRAQGLFLSDSLTEAHSLLMVLTYVFRAGKFNGSTLAVLGNYAVFDEVREMPIVGGSGKFRLARGYALAQTHSLDTSTGNGVIHYNLTVYHY